MRGVALSCGSGLLKSENLNLLADFRNTRLASAGLLPAILKSSGLDLNLLVCTCGLKSENLNLRANLDGSPLEI